MLTSSYGQLRTGLQKFQESAGTLDALRPESKGTCAPLPCKTAGRR
jgi:hypothetical protein